MKPIYFPYTYVPQWVAQALATCFEHFMVCGPVGTNVPHEMQTWVNSKVMEIHSPLQIDEQAIKRVIEDYRSFARLHQSSKEIKTTAVLRQQESVPFFDEMAVSRIVSEVKKNIESETSNKDLDALFCAQVFLHFAQEFDRQRDELSQGLGIYDQRSQELIKNLRGPDAIESLASVPATEITVEEAAEYMALDRLKAWVRLFMADPVDSGLFLTSSQSVFNHLMESQLDAEKIIESAQLPAVRPEDGAFMTWRNRFLKQIQDLIETEASEPAHDLSNIPRFAATGINVALTLYRLPARSWRDLFAPILGTQSNHRTQSQLSLKSKNILFGFFERQSFDLPDF